MICPLLFAVDWYASDASGIAYESVAQVAALRLEYALSVEGLPIFETPQEIRPKIPSGGSVELETFYNNGVKIRWRWSIRGANGSDRLIETWEGDGGVSVEVYDDHRRLVEERRLDSTGAGTRILYAYLDETLSRADAFSVPAIGALSPANSSADNIDAEPNPPLWTEYYRYTRSGSLRSVERVFPDGKIETVRLNTLNGVPRRIETFSADGSSIRTTYDTTGRVMERSKVDASGNIIDGSELTDYDPSQGNAAITKRTEPNTGIVVETDTDERGHVIDERRVDKDGTIIEQTITEWDKDRVSSVTHLVGNVARRTEYGYDRDGNRVLEKNYRNGTLERSVSKAGDSEIEELFDDGVPILRAVWVGGVKISEERLRKERVNKR